ncbi:MAG: hypothetical protein Q8S73_21130 [Deltaproteobacteria bacterium]|nr:hypothetical protein [Myxococcales bacterium]MDP3216627.1 hypothetical protein [Deltaproteobacteria bacterium]
METADFAPALQQLIARFRAWDEALNAAADDGEGLSRAERAALLAELRGVIADAGARPHSDPWQTLVGLFSPRALTPAEDRARREEALVRCYEQVCELKLPFQISSTLLRHHGAIKRAAHEAQGRRHLPTPPRGSAIAAPPSPSAPGR